MELRKHASHPMSKPQKKEHGKPSAHRRSEAQRLLATAAEVESAVRRSAAPDATSGASSTASAVEAIAGKPPRAPKKKERKRRRKPVRIGDALRRRGFDEQTVADHYVDVAQRLKGKSDKSGGVEKLLVDVLKECSRYLEPARPSERGDESSRGAMVHVHLVHNVTRPMRNAGAEASLASGSAIDVAPIAVSGRDATESSDDLAKAGGATRNRLCAP